MMVWCLWWWWFMMGGEWCLMMCILYGCLCVFLVYVVWLVSCCVGWFLKWNFWCWSVCRFLLYIVWWMNVSVVLVFLVCCFVMCWILVCCWLMVIVMLCLMCWCVMCVCGCCMNVWGLLCCCDGVCVCVGCWVSLIWFGWGLWVVVNYDSGLVWCKVGSLVVVC